jgi:tetratricopeptide (TPR) repeat protein
MSGGPSYLVVDDKLAAARAQWGRPSGRAEDTGKLTLKAGTYRFEYYTVQRSAQNAAVAAWKQPGAKTFDVIPQTAFPGVVQGRLVGYEIRGQAVAPDFSWANEGETFLGNRALVRMQFKDETTAQAAVGYSRQWAFGDGLAAREQRVSHIYLAPGAYKVTLRVSIKEQEFACSQTVRVDRAWAEQTTRQPDPPGSYAQRVQEYAFDQLSPESLAAAIAVLHEAKEWEAFGRAAREMTKPGQLEKLPPETLVEAVLTLGGDFRDTAHDPDGAIQLYGRAEKLIQAAPRKAQFALEIGDTHLYYLNDVERAREEYLRLVRTYSGADNMKVRQAHIRLGDTYGIQGKYDPAKEAYERAAQIKLLTAPPAGISSGARAFETETFLKRGDLDAAYSSLSAWEWECPTDKLVGEWSVLMGKWAIAKKNYLEAIKHLKQLVAVNPKSRQAPEALLLLATCYEQMRNVAEAIACLEAVKRDYPESALKAQAIERLEQLAPKLRTK